MKETFNETSDPFFNRTSSALLASACLLGLSAPALADCERGALDTLYCDTNGDMVADLPEDESQWQDPNTLIFAYTPVEDPAIYSDIWQPFIDHLEDVTERNVRFFAVQSNSAQVEAMRSGPLHIAGFSTGPTPFAVNLAGAVPFALMGSDSGQFGYTLQVYTHADSDIHQMSDLVGKRVAHTSPTSNSGNQAPRALFPELGIEPGEDYDITFSGSQRRSVHPRQPRITTSTSPCPGGQGPLTSRSQTHVRDFQSGQTLRQE